MTTGPSSAVEWQMATPDPAHVETSDQLVAALRGLRGTRSLRDLQAAAKELTGADGRPLSLPTSTVSDVLTGKSLPSVETLVALLRVCGISDESAQRAWLQARDRVEHRHQHRPPDTVRVRDARARLLGVHAAIHVEQPGQLGVDELPLYVPRDFDADLRTKITMAGQQGGFVLLVGGSSVGKTRALFEAVRVVLPDWWLLHPANAPALKEFGAAPTVRTVVWLDELQRYLDHPEGLPAATIRGLVGAGVVVAATLWPGEYGTRSAQRTEGQPDPYAGDRELLGMAEVVDVPKTFSPHERNRARDLAAADARVQAALDTPDAGFTQVMAAGPELVRWWEQAPEEHCYGQAVITAALDARRVGAHTPATRAYLEAAAPGYLSNRQQSTAPRDWLDQALTYATTLLRGATATLTPIPAGMGRTAGYEVADYLHQHALRVRRTTHLPDTTWHALVDHHHPDDTERLADNAERRGRNHEATTLIRQLADSGYLNAPSRLAELLVEQGRVDEALTHLRQLTDRGGVMAGAPVAELLVEQSQVDELTRRADNGNQRAASGLAELLAEQGRVDEALTRLRPLADNGDIRAANQLADLLAEQGRIDELAAEVAAGTESASEKLRSVRPYDPTGTSGLDNH